MTIKIIRIALAVLFLVGATGYIKGLDFVGVLVLLIFGVVDEKNNKPSALSYFWYSSAILFEFASSGSTFASFIDIIFAIALILTAIFKKDDEL